MKYTGIVKKGIQRGTRLGFPTLNIPISDESISGIYAGRVTCEGIVRGAAIYANQERKILEAYVLEETPDMYGKRVAMELLKKVRESEEFDDEEKLKVAIANDVQRVREYLKNV